jgi:D-arabinose 1-dehydrogenase-like Zn-dependent alcohol dehydrogenase
MKAAVIAEGHRFDVKEVPVPEIGSHEVLVQVKAVGIC